MTPEHKKMIVISLGIGVIVIGVIGLFISLSIDTTVSSGPYSTERVHNIGLMNEKQNLLLVFGVMAIIGALFTVAGFLPPFSQLKNTQNTIVDDFEERWNTLVKYDERAHAALTQIEPFGLSAIEELKRAFRVINDPSQLPKIVDQIIQEKKNRIIARVNEELMDITVPIPKLPPEAKGVEMVLIPAGTFTMGSPDTEKYRKSDEGPQHEVTLTKDFYLGKYEVTQAQWQAVMGSQPSYFAGKPNNPVERVSWYDAVKFCNALSKQSGLTPVYDESSWKADWNADGFRLPTEAEWEYACRAGTQTRFYWGDDPDYTQIKDYCWYSGNNSPNGTKEVGQKLPNGFGLFDMSGNMWEWCHDWWQNPFTRNAVADPVGPDSGSYRVLRGGSWYYVGGSCRSAYRNNNNPDGRDYYVGFRVSRTP